MSKPDGGPVSYSPKVWFGGEQIAGSLGLTLRDYFAAQAIAYVATAYVVMDERGAVEWCATRCYQLADAMLKEREK